MSRLNDVYTAMQTAIVNAINQFSGITTPAQCIVGWPNFEDLTKIIQQGQYLVSIFDTGRAVDTTRFMGPWMKVSAPNVPLTASITGNVLTFGGTCVSGLNVHTLVGAPLRDTLYQTQNSDTPSTVATQVATKINALAITGLSAAVSGVNVTVTGSPNLKCNIGGSTTLMKEVARQKRTLQVTAWCPTPAIRDAVTDAIEAYVGARGSSSSVFYPLPDGSNIWLELINSENIDDKQADYSMYRRHIIYTVEYGLLQSASATQIGAVQETYTVNGTTLPTITEG